MSESRNRKSMLLALLLFLGAGALLLFGFGEESPTKSSNDPARAKKLEDRVNTHLMWTNQKMELQRQRVMVDNNNYAKEIGNARPTVGYENNHAGVDLSTESHAADVANELGRGVREPRLPETPDEMIQSEIFNQQQFQEYSVAYKQEYAKKFVENAARSGWKVTLSPDYKVLSVVPIRSASGPNIFSETAGGASQ